MTWEIGLLFLLLTAMAYLFLTERLPVDLTAFLGLVVLTLGGYVAPEEAFSGFASPAVITMLSIFIVSAGLLQTGIADLVGLKIHALVGSREAPLVVTLMLVAGVLSAFMNNIAATAVLMPAVASVARRAQIPPSRLFMPLSFGAILGGTTTMVGTPPNIVAASMLQERNLEPFGLFDFTPIGLVLLITGTLFMVTLGRRLLPSREVGPVESDTANLTHVYQLQERLFSLRILNGSGLDGLSLASANLSSNLGVQVVAILRQGTKHLSPKADTALRGGDVLLVEGRLSELRDILRVGEVEVHPTTTGQLPRPVKGVTGIRAELLEDSNLIGRSLREVHFRENLGLIVVGIERKETTLREGLASEVLQKGDVVLALGARARLQQLGSEPGFFVKEIGLSAIRAIQDHLSVIQIPAASRLVGATVETSRLGELMGVTVGAIIRAGVTRLGVAPDEVIQAGDGLLVACDASRIQDLVQIGDVQLDARVGEMELESEDVGLVEAALAPRSSLVGKNPRELEFRDRYGLQLLAIWREGKSLYTGLADLVFRFGDALLVQGSWDRIRLLGSDPDFVVLSPVARRLRREKKAPFALGGLLLMIGLVVSGSQPIHVAAFTAASLVLLFGVLRMEEAYRAIEWRAVFLVAAVLPVGFAMDRTGAALLLATTVKEVAGPLGSYAILASLVLLASLLSQCLDGAPAVVLLAPVALESAVQLGMSPYTAMMGVSLAASAAFMTPFSHKANLLVMGAGGYRASDYVRVGTPLTIVVLALLVLLVPIFFPL